MTVRARPPGAGMLQILLAGAAVAAAAAPR